MKENVDENFNEEYLEKCLNHLNWNAGESHWKELQGKVHIEKGTWVAVNRIGNLLTAENEPELVKAIHDAWNVDENWFSPFIEHYGVPMPLNIQRILGSRSTNEHVTYSYATTINGELRSHANDHPVYFQRTYVDDGACKTTILQNDTKDAILGPFENFAGVFGHVTRARTYYKYVTIDGLRTLCNCPVDNMRLIGLDVIHRYTHTIDYRNPLPRVWTARPDLANHP